jgi:hypothetical protein
MFFCCFTVFQLPQNNKKTPFPFLLAEQSNQYTN